MVTNKARGHPFDQQAGTTTMAIGRNLLSKLGSVVESVKKTAQRVGAAAATGAKRDVAKAKRKLGRKAIKAETSARKMAERAAVRAKKALAKAKKTVAREAKAAKAGAKHLARTAQTDAGRAKTDAGKVKRAARKKVTATKPKPASPTAQVQKVTMRIGVSALRGTIGGQRRCPLALIHACT